MLEGCKGCLKEGKCPPLIKCPCEKCLVKSMCSDPCIEYLHLRNEHWQQEFEKLVPNKKLKIEVKHVSVDIAFMLIDDYEGKDK